MPTAKHSNMDQVNLNLSIVPVRTDLETPNKILIFKSFFLCAQLTIGHNSATVDLVIPHVCPKQVFFLPVEVKGNGVTQA